MPEHRPKVDYALRPAKGAVRQMAVKALARLGPLMPLSEYRYIGMGSIYFRDFQLVHRQLGIDDMISIEGDPDAKERVRFNCPLACIDLKMGTTGEVLPQLGLEEKPHILWLDYESRVGPDVLADIDETVGRCASGSVLIVTVNASRPRRGRERDAWLSGLGNDRPEPRDPGELAEYALLSYRVLRARIDAALEARNAGVREPERVNFYQAFHWVYSDGAQMLTIGGGLVAETARQQWDACEVESLEFTQSGEEPYKVEVPKLTRREVHHLLRELPESQGDLRKAAEAAGIPLEDAREFAAVYRYAPLFVEAEDW